MKVIKYMGEFILFALVTVGTPIVLLMLTGVIII
jgi:hypothetical protein|tara:strand:- start:524 stop:625 length:102 start_codon:yes stop_codon:yes gene_type:complete